MDFVISLSDFKSAVSQIFPEPESESIRVVEMAASGPTLSISANGKKIELPLRVAAFGSASIPVDAMSGMRRISGTFDGQHFRITTVEGMLHFQSEPVS